MSAVRDFIRRNYRHFNAAALVDAAEGYRKHLEGGGRMLVTLAGAMSTAELGLSLARMIRCGCVHAISCTGANLEEDLFNLVAHSHYLRVPHYRELSAKDEQALLDRHLNRVTDTCIPEEEAIRRIEAQILDEWQAADRSGQRHFPHEFMYRLIRSGVLEKHYQIDPADSWLVAACEKDLPMVVPGWEDSTLGNIFVAHVVAGDLSSYLPVRAGVEYMGKLVDWYRRESAGHSLGFFQIGGGIAGDFPICVVPLIQQDLQEETPFWGYFCQISDSTTSFG
ncbi:MAG TPA: deoxyhypusine synthase family protein, partial [Burkholderiales bacterium]|nr:deoxyhypusine synthase family protein [Burkholderiales bacterium]